MRKQRLVREQQWEVGIDESGTVAPVVDAGRVFAALAMDQRNSLRQMMASAAGVERSEIPDSRLSEFKQVTTSILAPHASAVLLDAEFSNLAMSSRGSACGLLVAYESDGYENPRPHKMLALMPHVSVLRLREMGADGVKILLTYTPFDDPSALEAKHALIERIGHECDALNLPFFLEPVGYDPGGLDLRGFEYAQRKPQIVIRSMEEFSKPRYKVDVLKVEFPVNVAYVEGSPVYEGRPAYSRSEALQLFREADSVARRPYIYLSAGVRGDAFVESLRLASEAGARYSGVLCGRATWQDGVSIFMREGREALEQWLRTTGVKNIQAVNDCLREATPWHAKN